jgi:catechol 2,3-dioxygenase-like lactoylglutathione lyase family enzyme
MRPGFAGYGLDHLQLLVEDADANAKLFQDIYAGELIESRNGTRVLKVIDITVVVSEPADLGLDPAAVEPRNVDTKFRYGVDHIAWIFEDVYAAAAAAKAKGYTFTLEPIRFHIRGEPTLYDFGYLFSPDGLQLELMSEQWRVGPRTVFKAE